MNKLFLSLILLLTATTAALGGSVTNSAASGKTGQPATPQSPPCSPVQTFAPSTTPDCQPRQPSDPVITRATLGTSITGTVSNENGQPIAESTLCLSLQSAAPSDTPSCLQTQASNGAGNYTFEQVAAGAYVVTIIDNRFPTFTWLPVARKVNITQSSGQIAGLNFKRQFSFSNFQKAVTLHGSDLPELAGFNLSQDTVFVKVYAVDPATPSRQTVFFMGRLTNEANLKFAASAPWAIKEVIYEIFSPTAARQGSLLIQS